MLSLQTWRSFRLAAAMLVVVAAAVPVAQASVIQPTATLPPTAGSYTAGTVCVNLGVLSGGVCVVGQSLGNFTSTISMFPGTGQAIDSNVTLTADIYTNSGGSPGTFIAPLLLGGPIGIFYAGRMSDDETGTFTSSLTELDLTGTFLGHSLEVKLSPTTSSGPTTVAMSGSDFMITSFFDVFAEISLDHGSFIPGPPGTFTLTPTPEPGSISLLALGWWELRVSCGEECEPRLKVEVKNKGYSHGEKTVRMTPSDDNGSVHPSTTFVRRRGMARLGMT